MHEKPARLLLLVITMTQSFELVEYKTMAGKHYHHSRVFKNPCALLRLIEFVFHGGRGSGGLSPVKLSVHV